MRNISEMTVVEQVVAIRESVCAYACKYKEAEDRKYKDEVTQKIMVQRYCRECPLTRLHCIEGIDEEDKVL